MNKDKAYKRIQGLVNKFGKRIDEYKSGKYNETQTRNEFVDPFFEALGWDINDRQSISLPYRDVIKEGRIKVAGSSKAPDYSFNIKGDLQFFVDAKKPSIKIKDEKQPAFQVRTYGWNAKRPSIVFS